jgi:cytochrome c-type biogenesis protein CcmH/NrfG
LAELAERLRQGLEADRRRAAMRAHAARPAEAGDCDAAVAAWQAVVGLDETDSSARQNLEEARRRRDEQWRRLTQEAVAVGDWEGCFPARGSWS